jgi:hypothetical protein
MVKKSALQTMLRHLLISAMEIVQRQISYEKIALPVRFAILVPTGFLCLIEPYFLRENIIGGMTGILVQGHFLMGYLYQYKSGKINQTYALRYLPVALLLFAACLLLPVDRLLTISATGYFLIHFFYDERYMLREEAELSGWKIALPTIGLLFAEILYRYAGLRSLMLILGAFILSGLYISWLILSEIMRTHRFSWRSGYFLTTFAMAAALTLSGKIFPGPVNPNALHFLFLLHSANWYWRYVQKFSVERNLLRKFCVETMAVNMVLGSLMFFRYHSSYSILLSALAGVLFMHPYFQVWSLLHFVATYRSQDIMNWIPLRNNT